MAAVVEAGAASALDKGCHPRRVDEMPDDDRPPADPAKLLSFWMEWERGEELPGRVLANLKTGGLRELLEATVSAQHEAFGTSPSS